MRTHLLLLLSLVLSACTSSGTAELGGTTKLPGAGPVHAEASLTWGQDGVESGTTQATAPPQLAGLCFQRTFVQNDGSHTSTTTTIGPDGSVGGFQVPPGTVYIHEAVVLCNRTNQLVPAGLRQRYPLKTYYLTGRPLYIDGSPITLYAMTVMHALRIAQEVVDRGPGAALPAGVTVHWLAKLVPLASGGVRFTAASIGSLEEFTLDLNGARYADFIGGLANNLVHYDVNGWAAVEVMLDDEDLDLGVEPGVWYENDLAATLLTDAMGESFWTDLYLHYQP